MYNKYLILAGFLLGSGAGLIGQACIWTQVFYLGLILLVLGHILAIRS